MITAIVRFPLPQGLSSDDVKAIYEHSVPQFRGAAGLIRKYYLHGADQTGGGVYLWESREAAEMMYSEAWRQQIANRFGAAPQIEYFETPVIIDNTGTGAE
ncbi:monooxygenase [Microvirga sesbaniae]|uniref:monooxygenase n=1 Tax=Microvirga sesbaniae TaxID=681392 RepID=UPI0021C90231|nr:monooxygenase [Microvirga sp. HBU67692]